MIRVALVGALGRMGRAMTVGLSDPIVVTARVDVLGGDTVATALDELDPTTVDVVVDFSNADGARRSVDWRLAHGVAAVLESDGVTYEEIESWAKRANEQQGHLLVAANFSIGAVLATRFAAMAAPYFTSVEIVELHHDNKKDAPSGTSLAIARAIESSRELAGASDLFDPTTETVIEGARGAASAGECRIRSVRQAGLVAHHEILLGSRRRSTHHPSRQLLARGFVEGVALAVREVRQRPGLTWGLDALLA
jgi:4-hydroxy-tetrahydrodipicolinate reductase